MTVRELIDELNKLPENATVLTMNRSTGMMYNRLQKEDIELSEDASAVTL